MKQLINKKIKFGLVVGVVTLGLTGCGSSSEEEQIAWLNNWDSIDKIEQKMNMVNACFREAGVKSNSKRMSKKQSEIMNECELSYIAELAEIDGVSLDRNTIKNNIIQF